MVTTEYGGRIIRGTNAERTGGTWTALAAGWLYIETDTQAFFYWNGTAWAAVGGGGTTTWLPSSFYIYKDTADSTYKAKNMTTGLLLGTTSTTDCGVVLQAAITTLSSGGEIKFGKGIFTCLTAIVATDTSGLKIIGEGRATKLDFTPASAVTDAITIQGCFDFKLKDFWIKGSTNITNVIHIKTSATQITSQRGEIAGCLIDGSTKTTGHHGIWLDGAKVSGVGGTYYWHINDNAVINEDIGIQLTPTVANANFINNNHFGACNVGIDLDGIFENLLVNNFGQTMTTATIRLNNNGTVTPSQYNTILSTQADGASSPVVLLESGCQFNVIMGVVETGGTRVTDNSGKKNFILPGLLITSHANLTVGASPYTYMNTDGYPIMVHVKGGVVSDISFKRETTTQSLYNDTAKSVRLDCGDSIILTYSVLPTAVVIPAG